MSDKHLSSQFDAELSGISTRVLEMGGLVESQVALAIEALTHFNGEVASQVLIAEEKVNLMEMQIDADLSTIIARRQPTARDLRLLIAISKTIGNLERVGDEAARIARTVQRLINTGVSSRLRLSVTCPSKPAWPPPRCASRLTLSPAWTPRRRWKSSRATTRSTPSSTA